MSRRSKQDWQELIEEQASSDLTAAAFCRKKGINAKYFSLRKSQLAKQLPSAFVPVQLSTSPASTEVIRIDWQGISVILPMSLSPVWLSEFVKHLSL